VSSAKREPFSAARLRSLLEAEIADPLAASYCVAFSGGADSTALLAAMAELLGPGQRGALRAIHIDHGLNPLSAQWARTARANAAKLGVACTVERVRVTGADGESLEAAAREARYAALAGALAPDECLLTAHHVDDQLETVLLQLARGAGVAGFAAMPVCARLGAGRHLRPLLGVTHAALVGYLGHRALGWIEDPMNTDPRFDRGFLRASVIPELRARWPSIAANAARSARHMADAQRTLDAAAERDWARARDGDRLDLAGLAGFEPGRAANLLRFWIRRQGRPLPSTGNLERLLAMMTGAASDATPRVRWPGADVRRYRGRLYIAASHERPALGERSWHWDEAPRLTLEEGLGSLRMTKGRGAVSLARGLLPPKLTVKQGAAGESLRPAAGARQRTLRNLFQEQGVVPWVRSAVPFVYHGRELVAVGYLWADARFLAGEGEPAVHIEWSGGPELY